MLDIIGLTILVIFFIRGYMKGIIVAVFSVLAIILGIACALKLSGWLGEWLLAKGWATSGWVQLISYIILFIAVFIIVTLLAKIIEKTLQLAMLGWINGIIGGFLYAFLGAVVWSSLLWILNQLHVLSPETIAYSKTYSYFEPLAPWVFDHIGNLIPFAKDLFTDLKDFFDKTNQHLPEHVGTH
jgi:membrane protein required for colicin V production